MKYIPFKIIEILKFKLGLSAIYKNLQMNAESFSSTNTHLSRETSPFELIILALVPFSNCKW